jgi:hypothetical protein
MPENHFRQRAQLEQHSFVDEARRQCAVQRPDVGCRSHAARRLSYAHAVKSILTAAAMLTGVSMPQGPALVGPVMESIHGEAD